MTQTQDDVAKIEAYRKSLGKYPKPSVTADIAAVYPAYSELGEGQWRENPAGLSRRFGFHRGGVRADRRGVLWLRCDS